MMQSAGIVVNDVTVTWRNGHTALRDASFTVPSGSIAALVGVNGSGKSTLFKAIMGFVRLTSGKISVLGIPTRQALQKNLVAYVPQSEEVDWSFPVLVEDVVLSPMRWNVSIWWIFAIDKSASFPVDKRNASFWRERLHSRVM